MTDSLDWSKIALFDGFSEEWLTRARGIFDRLDVPAGTLLIEEGQSGDEMYILVRGRVRVTKSMLLKDMSLPLAVVENPRKVLATLDGSRFPLFGGDRPHRPRHPLGHGDGAGGLPVPAHRP